jgi:hypothetical protein
MYNSDMNKNRVFSVGESDLDGYDLDHLPEGVDWVVYDYSSTMYDGLGELVYKLNGELFITNLGHCSCYGPIEEQDSGVRLDLDADSIHDSHIMYDSVRNKVMELVG